MIEIRNISKSFEDKKVLDHLSFQIKEGEIAGISGENGGGKSTLCRIIVGLEKPDEGNIFLNELALFDKKLNYRRKKGLTIQLLPQNPFLYFDPLVTVESSLLELIRYHKLAPRKEERSLLLEAINEVELSPHLLKQKASDLSGGEAERLLLAKSLLLHPSSIILDEATSMLDMTSQANLLGLLKRKFVSKGGSLLFITHDQDLLKAYCSSSYLLKDKNLERIL